MDSNTPTIEEIRDLLSQLSSHDGRYAVFGAQGHHYKLRPALSEVEVAAFEASHGVTLPPSYRTFITQLGNGGVGPAYGIHELERALDNPWMELGSLAQPFEIDDASSDANYEGCLLISQRGCGGWTFLIVAGPLAGQIWYDDTVAEMGFSEAGEDFLGWYKSWLVASLEVANQSDGMTPQHQHHKLVQELIEAIQDNRLPQLLDTLPNDATIVHPLASVASSLLQAGHAAEVLPLYARIFEIDVPEGGQARDEYLKAINNGCIAAFVAKRFDVAADLADRGQVHIPENPYIAHSAACAYVAVGDFDKALEQCRLAVEHEYPHLDALATDTDLAPIADRPEFRALFADTP